MNGKISIKLNRFNINELFYCFGMIGLSYLVMGANSISTTTTRVILFSFAMVVFSLLFFSRGFFEALNSRSGLFLILFLLLLFPFSFYAYGLSTTIGAILSQVAFFSGIFFTMILICQKNNQVVKVLFWCILIIWIYENIQLFKLSLTFPDIGRAIASHSADYSLVASIGSTYGIAQSTCLIAIVLFKLATDKAYQIPFSLRVLFVLIVAFFCVSIYLVQSTITTLILGVGIIFAGFINLRKNGYRQRKAKILLAIIFFVFVLFIFREQIGYFLINLFSAKSNFFEVRMVEIGRLLTIGSMSGDMEARIGLIVQSWESIWVHPFFGNAYMGGSVSGNHSHIFDILSDYGLLMGSSNFLIVYYFEKIMYRNIQNYDTFAWLPMLVMSFANPMRMYQVYYSVLFIIPLSYMFFKQYGES